MQITLPITEWKVTLRNWIPAKLSQEAKDITLEGQTKVIDGKKLTDKEIQQYLTLDEYANYQMAKAEAKDVLYKKAKVASVEDKMKNEIPFTLLMKAEVHKTVGMVTSIDVNGDEEFTDMTKEQLLEEMPEEDFDFIATSVAEQQSKLKKEGKKSGASVKS